MFAGPLDLSTVEWLAGPAALDPLAVLVDKSLVVSEPAPVRPEAPTDRPELSYRILDPIRAFVVRALARGGGEAAARDRHLAWARDTIDRVHVDDSGKPLTLSTYPLDRLAAEVRASLHWSVASGRIREGLHLAVQLDEWWRERGLAREGRLWLFRLFEKLDGTSDEIPAAELAWRTTCYARHAGADGEFGEQLRLLVQAEDGRLAER